MAKEVRTAGSCPECSAGSITCSHNVFQDDATGLRIDSWEHRCSNCGYRVTRAIRSDDEEETDPEHCPFCA